MLKTRTSIIISSHLGPQAVDTSAKQKHGGKNVQAVQREVAKVVGKKRRDMLAKSNQNDKLSSRNLFVVEDCGPPSAC